MGPPPLPGLPSPDYPPPPAYGPFAAALPQRRGLYPLDVGRTMRATLSLFRFKWRPLMAIALVMGLPSAVIASAISAASVGEFVAWQQEVSRNMFTGRTAEVPFPWSAVGAMWLGTVVSGIFSYLGVAGMIHVVAATIAGEPSGVSSAIRFVRANALRIIGLWLLFAFLAGALPMLSFIYPALTFGASASGTFIFLSVVLLFAAYLLLVYLIVRLQLVVQVLVVEGRGPLDALRRGWQVMRGSMWRMLGYLLLLGLAFGLPVGMAAVVIGFIIAPPRFTSDFMLIDEPTSTFVQSLLGAAGVALIMPIFLIATTLLYFDIRWRRGESVPEPG